MKRIQIFGLLLCVGSLAISQPALAILNLFKGSPSGSQKCDSFWPRFTDPKQIYDLFDPNWEKITLEHKRVRKVYYFNLVGIQHPSQTQKLLATKPVDIEKMTPGEEIALVPSAQDKKRRDNICHYAFKLKGETNTLVQIARVENIEDQEKYTRDALLVQNLERHLHDLAAALPELAPAIISSVQAGTQIGTLVNGGMPATQDDLAVGLGAAQTPMDEALNHWANFFNKLLGVEGDEDWLVPEDITK